MNEWCNNYRSKATQELSHEITNFYELANKNQVSLPVALNSCVSSVFRNSIGCDYYTCKKIFDSLQQPRDTSKSLLRSVLFCLLLWISLMTLFLMH